MAIDKNKLLAYGLLAQRSENERTFGYALQPFSYRPNELIRIAPFHFLFGVPSRAASVKIKDSDLFRHKNLEM